MRKIFKVIGIALVTISLLFLVVGFLFYKHITANDYSANDSVTQAFLFAQSSNKQQCLTKYRSVYKICSNDSCDNSPEEFVKVCLSFSSGEKNKFCVKHSDFNQSHTELLNSVGFCKKHGVVQNCEKMNSVLKEYCE
jgi:hypothetical protein